MAVLQTDNVLAEHEYISTLCTFRVIRSAATATVEINNKINKYASKQLGQLDLSTRL